MTYVFFCKKSVSKDTEVMTSELASKRYGRTSSSWLMESMAHLRCTSENPTYPLGTSTVFSSANMKCCPGAGEMSAYLI